MKRRTIRLLAGVVTVVSLVSAGSGAYFTNKKTVRQVITTGSIQIVLNDEADSSIPVMPGSVLHRPVSVSNVGENAAWIRVKVQGEWEFSDSDERDDVEPALDYDLLTWQMYDGWYYLNEALECGETSSELFTTLTFPLSLDNSYEASSYHFSIQAEAVQKINNASTVLEAEGWPE